MPSLPFKTSKKVIVQEILTLALVLLTFVLAFCYYDRLPAQIANHFNFRGEPNEFSGRKIFWSLPVFSAAIYLVLSMIWIFIRLVAPGEKLSTEALPVIGRMLRQLKLLLVMAILFLLIATIRISMGKAEGLGGFYTPVFLLAIFSILALNLIQLFRMLRKQS